MDVHLKLFSKVSLLAFLCFFSIAQHANADAFQQDQSSDSLIVFDAEHFQTNTAQGSHSWNIVRLSGYTGSGSVQAFPTDNAIINTGFQANSPHLQHQALFNTSGTHYIWVRGRTQGSVDDTLHIGLDGIPQATSESITGFTSNWGWVNATVNGPAASLVVASTGLHNIDIWMGKAGLIVDKIVITTNPNFVPTNEGPIESVNGLAIIPGNLSGTIINDSVLLANQTYTVTGNITVQNGVLLTIQPGVKIVFSGRHYFYVDGAVRALGSTSASVEFTSGQSVPAPGDWQGLFFRSNDTRNHFDHVEIKYATSAMYFMSGYGGATRLHNSTIDQNTNGIYVTGDGDVNHNPNVIVTNNNIINTTGYSYYVTQLGEPKNVILDATNNWWGSTDFSVVQQKIYDLPDNPGYPYLSWVNASTILDGFNGSVYSKELLRVPLLKNRILPENKQFIILEDYTVAADETLTIEKGVKIEIGGVGTELIVDGVLKVQGDATSKVTFTSILAAPTNRDWQGIKFRSNSPSNLVDHALIEYAYNGIYFQENSFATITNSLIQNNNYGIYAQGNNQEAANPSFVIKNNQILNNTQYNFYSNYFSNNAKNIILDVTNNWWGTTEFKLIHSKIYDNSDYAIYAPWVDIGTILNDQGIPQTKQLLHSPILQDTTLIAGVIYEVSKDFTVNAGNTLTIPAGTKIQVQNAGTDFFIDGTLRVLGTTENPVVFTSALVSPLAGSWSGITIRSKSPNNLIDHAIIEYAQNGINFLANTFSTVTNSLIQNNRYGIYAQGNNQELANPKFVIKNNKIQNNTYYNLNTNYFGNPKNTILDLTDNWWGTTDFTQIHTKIYDNSDNPTYAPWVDTTTILDSQGNVFAKKLLKTISPNTRLITGETYQFINNINIPIGSSLTIESGVIIEALGNYVIAIDGILAVQGTAASPVTFTSGMQFPAIGNWQGLVIRSNSIENVIDHAVVEYGYYGVSYQANSYGVITNSVIQKNLYGVYIMGNIQVALNPNVSVTTSSLIDNQYYNLYANYFGSPTTITINAADNWWGSTDLVTIKSKIYDNTDNPSYAPVVNITPISNVPLWLTSEPIIVVDGDLLPTTISSDTTLTTGTNYRLDSDVTVTAGATLTIEPGVKIQAKYPTTELIIDGVINVLGTVDNPVIFTSSAVTPAPGDWQGITVRSDSALNTIDNAVVEYSNYGVYFQASSSGSVKNSLIHNNNYGIYVTGNNLEASNPTPIVNNNKILNNVTYNYYANVYGNAKNITLNAINNWWGTTDFTQIYNTIHDNTDNPTYAPWVDVGTIVDSQGVSYTSSVLLYIPVTTDLTLTNVKPYEVVGQLDIASTATLTLNAGTQLKLLNSNAINVNGTLRVLGTETAPVVFTSASVSPSLGDWPGIVINSNSTQNIIDYALIEYATNGIAFKPGSYAKVSNSTIQNNITGLSATGDGVLANNPVATVNNNIIINNTTQFSSGSFANGGNTILDAKNNWWGTTDFKQIHSKILDMGDYASTTTSIPWIDTSSVLDAANGSVYSTKLFRIYTESDQVLPAGQAYEMIRDVYVKAGYTLTINDGVSVNALDKSVELFVDGVINVVGTALNPVVFTSSIGTPTTSGWTGIKLRSNSTLNRIKFAKIEYATYGLYFDNASYTVVNNSDFNFNSNAIYITNSSNPVITSNNTISQNSIGIYVAGNGVTINNPAPTISGNSIFENSSWNYFATNFGDSAATQLDANGNWWGSTDFSLIRSKIYDHSNVLTSPWVITSTILDTQGQLFTSNLIQLPITSNQTLDAGKKYQITNDLNVNAGATLTVPAGTQLEFNGVNSTISVDGVLRVLGTQGNPVVLTSSSATPASGDWKGIQVRSNDAQNLIDYAVIEYATNGVTFLPGSSGKITNSIISKNNYGIYANGDNTVENNPVPIVTGNQIFSNAQFNYFATTFGDAINTVLDATGNWWGTTDFKIIHSKIYERKETATAPWIDTGTILDSQLAEFSAKLLRLPIKVSTSLNAGQRYQMIESVTVEPAATLTINAGVRIESFAGTNQYSRPSLDIDGVLDIKGVVGNPVILTSIEPVPKENDWNGINIRSSSPLNSIDYAVIEHANNAVAFRAGSSGKVLNSIITNNAYGIYAYGDGVAANNPTPVVNNNSITLNTFNYQASGFGDGGNAVLDAKNNWWGSTNFKTIHAKIIDHGDVAIVQYPWIDTSAILDAEFGEIYSKRLLRRPVIADLALPENQHYEMFNDVTVAEGATLTINPGVQIEATETYIALKVNGTLKALGTAASSVVFTSSDYPLTGGYWDGIKFSSTSINNELAYVVVEYATSGIMFTDASGYLHHSLIQNNQTGVFIIGNSNPILTSNTIINNSYGIHIQGKNNDTLNPQPTITGNDIYNNSVQLIVSNFGLTSTLKLDVTKNWWGTETPQVGKEIAYSNSAEVADFSLFKTMAQNGPGLSGLTLSQFYFSPNGDAIKDVTQIMGTLSQATGWKVDVKNSKNQLVKTQSGTGSNVNFTWDGKNQSSALQSDGKYIFIITATSTTGTVQVGSRYTVLDATYPVADISDTLNNSIIQNQLEFNITGSAGDTNFVDYKVEYGVGVSPAAWTTINTSQTIPVKSGSLISWIMNSNNGTISALPSGDYTVRLTVSDTAGNISVDAIKVSINLVSLTNVSLDNANINILINSLATVTFNVNQASTVVMNIYTQPAESLVSTRQIVTANAGQFALTWDGKDNQGNYLPDEAYEFKLVATAGTSTAIYDTVNNPNLYNGGSNYPVEIPNSTFPYSHNSIYNSYKNVFWKLKLGMQYPGRIHFSINSQQYKNGQPFFIYDGEPLSKGEHWIYWDGRDPDGNFITGVASYFFDTPTLLDPDTIIVKGHIPTVTGFGVAPNIEVKSDPYLVTHSYEQVSQMGYRIDQDSTITFKLLPPTIMDINDPSAVVLLSNVFQQANDAQGNPIEHVVKWDGIDLPGSNNIKVTDEGPYTFAIEATSNTTGLTKLYRGVIQLYQ